MNKIIDTYEYIEGRKAPVLGIEVRQINGIWYAEQTVLNEDNFFTKKTFFATACTRTKEEFTEQSIQMVCARLENCPAGGLIRLLKTQRQQVYNYAQRNNGKRFKTYSPARGSAILFVERIS